MKKAVTLESLMLEARKAYSEGVRRHYRLACIYVQVIDLYGSAGKRAFLAQFPITVNTLRNLEKVGRGLLLPQFIFCSNKFTAGILKLKNSMEWQYILLGASKNGYIRVSRGDKTLDMKLSTFLERNSDAVLSIVSKSEVKLSSDELLKKITENMSRVREEAKKLTPKKEKFTITEKDGHKVCLFRKGSYTKDELLKIIEQL